jgi:LacI family transcriptional regulator
MVETSRSYGRELLFGIARYVRAHGPWDIEFTESNPAEKLPKWFHNWEGDGILARVMTPAIAEAVIKRGLPVVDLYGGLRNLNMPCLRSDEAAVGRLAAEHLMERNISRFAFCGFSGMEWSELRRAGFQNALAKAGYPCEVFETPRTECIPRPSRKLPKWLKGLPKPIGIMACNDFRGREILNVCRGLGLAVPDTLAVIGVDKDEVLCELSNIPLSSVALNTARIGYEAAALLDRMMRGEKAPAESILIEPAGVSTRRSTDVLSAADSNLTKALTFIRDHVYERLTIDVVAEFAGLSRSVLQRRFRAVFHETVHDAIMRMRLKRACELLTLTDLPQIDVAEKSGFKHCEYMGAVFKARVGKTPAQYRREFSILSPEQSG